MPKTLNILYIPLSYISSPAYFKESFYRGDITCGLLNIEYHPSKPMVWGSRWKCLEAKIKRVFRHKTELPLLLGRPTNTTPTFYDSKLKMQQNY